MLPVSAGNMVPHLVRIPTSPVHQKSSWIHGQQLSMRWAPPVSEHTVESMSAVMRSDGFDKYSSGLHRQLRLCTVSEVHRRACSEVTVFQLFLG